MSKVKFLVTKIKLLTPKFQVSNILGRFTINYQELVIVQDSPKADLLIGYYFKIFINGIVLYSLCETSCALRTVFLISQAEKVVGIGAKGEGICLTLCVSCSHTCICHDVATTLEPLTPTLTFELDSDLTVMSKHLSI